MRKNRRINALPLSPQTRPSSGTACSLGEKVSPPLGPTGTTGAKGLFHNTGRGEKRGLHVKIPLAPVVPVGPSGK